MYISIIFSPCFLFCELNNKKENDKMNQGDQISFFLKVNFQNIHSRNKDIDLAHDNLVM